MLSNIDEAFDMSFKHAFISTASSNLVTSEILSNYSTIETLSPDLDGLSNLSSGMIH